jgi:hypothetical protein
MTSTLDKDNGMRRYDDQERAIGLSQNRIPGPVEKRRKAEASTVVMKL